TNKVTLIILDIQIPDTNSFELLQFIRNLYPDIKVLIFSMGSESLYGKRFITAGAHGYLSKEAPMQEIHKAIETILSGKKYMTEKLVELIIHNVLNDKDENPFSNLSAREFEIATFLLQGLTITSISEIVHLQSSTVGTYKTRIFEKLQVTNLMELKELALVYNFK
ncbi:MAG: response regulator, partial [Chitinophagaceae bacterium]